MSANPRFDTSIHQWMMPVIGAWPLILLLAAASPGDLSRAHRLIEEDLKYREAITLLEELLREGELATEDRVQAARLLGIASAATGDAARAEQAFVIVLELEPTYQLDARHSPKIRSAFESAQTVIASRPRITRVVALTEQRKVEVIATLHDPKSKVQAMLLFSRFDQGAFERRPMQQNPKGARLTLKLPQRLESRLEYFVEAHANTGAVLAQAGSAQAPSSVVINRQVVKTKTPKPAVESSPWYRKWWVWAIAAGVVVAAGATTVVVTRGGSDEPVGSLDPIRLP